MDDGVAVVTLNRPASMNAWNDQMSAELSNALRVCDEDDAVRAVVLTGAGRAFCAGQDLSAGDRASGGAPPRIPHRILMRENCGSCHDGPAAREEIRTSHPERTRCRQCHVPVAGTGTFSSEPAGG